MLKLSCPKAQKKKVKLSKCYEREKRNFFFSFFLLLLFLREEEPFIAEHAAAACRMQPWVNSPAKQLIWTDMFCVFIGSSWRQWLRGSGLPLAFDESVRGRVGHKEHDGVPRKVERRKSGAGMQGRQLNRVRYTHSWDFFRGFFFRHREAENSITS